MANFCPGIIWSIIWLLLLWIIVWPVCGFLASLYVFLLPFSACIPALKGACDTLLRWVQFLKKIGENIKNMDELCQTTDSNQAAILNFIFHFSWSNIRLEQYYYFLKNEINKGKPYFFKVKNVLFLATLNRLTLTLDTHFVYF